MNLLRFIAAFCISMLSTFVGAEKEETRKEEAAKETQNMAARAQQAIVACVIRVAADKEGEPMSAEMRHLVPPKNEAWRRIYPLKHQVGKRYLVMVHKDDASGWSASEWPIYWDNSIIAKLPNDDAVLIPVKDIEAVIEQERKRTLRETGDDR